MHEKNMKFSLLLDIYGDMLNERKRELLQYYYEDDYSLSEISEITGISRQGVRDSIKKSEEEIKQLEQTLKIADKNTVINDSISKIEALISSDDKADKEIIIKELQKIKNILHS